MAIEKNRVTKTINLDLSDVPVSDRSRVKQEVGDFIVDEILRSVSKATSPVAGGKYKASLNTAYAKAEKGGNTTANLELDGDMLDSLTFKNTKGGIEVGIFNKSQTEKAYGHNTGFEGHKYLAGKGLERRFIPDTDQKFKKDIETGIKDIVKEFKKSEKPRDSFFDNIDVTQESDEGVEIQVNDIFSSSFLDDVLKDMGIS